MSPNLSLRDSGGGRCRAGSRLAKLACWGAAQTLLFSCCGGVRRCRYPPRSTAFVRAVRTRHWSWPAWRKKRHAFFFITFFASCFLGCLFRQVYTLYFFLRFFYVNERCDVRSAGVADWNTAQEGGIRSARSPLRRAPLLATPIAMPLQCGRP